MIRNYLLIALRNIQRNSVYSFINIFGLAVGIASSILILFWVADETSYDAFHENADRLSQVWINATYDGKVNTFNSVPYPTYGALKTTDSRIKNTAIANWGGESLLAVGETRANKFSFYASEEFLTMFKFELLKGDPAQVLKDPNSIVISESTAKTFFGDKDPINQLIKVDNSSELKVTGVMKDFPKNSSFDFEVLIPIKQLESQDWMRNSINNWGNYSFQVYVELQPEVKKEDVDAAIKDLLIKNGQTDVPREFFLHPLDKWRLYSNFENGKISGGMIDYVKGFSIIAIFVLVIACINFMNLATARSERRAREVGVRKSVGSKRRDLVFQFLGESILITTIAFIISIIIVEAALPFYNDLTQKQLGLDFSSANFWLGAIAIILITGVFAGSYPALYLSSFNPVKVLKGKIQQGKSVATPRKILVILQFFFSTLLIIGTIVITEQIAFVKARDLGYNQENLITIPYTTEIAQSFKAIRQELVATGAVSSITKSNSPITEVYSNNFLEWPGKPEEQKVLFITIATELDYTKTMGIKILEGRDFIDDRDTASILINKAAAEVMGLKETVGTKVSFWGEENRATIVGIIDNVTMGSPYRQASPLFVTYIPDWASAVTVRLEPTADLPGAIAKVESVFKKFNPAYPFEYTFVDEQFAKKFATINLISTLSKLFALLAIIITGLGLFGLASFTAEQRTKEIGIRKVLGASVTGLVSLISKEFSWLVIIAMLVSSPVAWYTLNSFLERYPYRIEFPWWSLLLAGGIALLFALLIVSIQAFKAATANPSKSLRSE
ncbi:MAG: ABC transporter permease [Cyclobacteriaceae bacterium]|jgi:putative ABC transport system permease protein|nr:ABC transporter permease [Cytophagales bacterium]MCZ8328896.1 ABC transporter permease [Cyclobacteriaceae bacterium]